MPYSKADSIKKCRIISKYSLVNVYCTHHTHGSKIYGQDTGKDCH